ncbi:MAG: hypothetical protein KF871_15495 [Hydrogenophaga sp.]|uniref:hypothetical protein n=1 Tax=Hydrogenophaga sp. TaxID=1904254 RepID=UPI001E1790A2|nr:hypothetical protein [Hydrogenophaga sp.]MBX3611296.1 hypothetical protein [Hydrogenophaga sp.]
MNQTSGTVIAGTTLSAQPSLGKGGRMAASVVVKTLHKRYKYLPNRRDESMLSVLTHRGVSFPGSREERDAQI